MAELVTIDPSVHERLYADILDTTFPIWHEGLSRDAYARWNLIQLRTVWGAAHLRRVALIEGDAVLASAKWYDIDARLDGQPARVLGIGAVFTPEALRGRGHAADLMQRMMAEAERDGYHAAVLFSEIGASYYEAMGFTAIPRETVTLDVIRKPGAPMTLVRATDETDMERLAGLHETGDAFARFTPIRTVDLIRFAAQKRRAKSALAPMGVFTTEFYVSEEGNHAVSYVLLTRGPSGNAGDGPEVMWLDACGDRDPTGARVGSMLQVLLAREPSHTPPVLKAWLPDGWLPPQVRIVSRAPAEEILMVKPLGGRVLPSLHGREVTWWHGDVF